VSVSSSIRNDHAQRGPIKVLVVDAHRMFAEALEMLLAGEQDLEVVGTAATGEEAVELVEAVRPRVVLIGIALPTMGGIEATRRIRQVSPSTQVIIVSAYLEPEVMAQAIEAGACGLVPKTHPVDKLVLTIRQVAQGEIAFPGSDMSEILSTVRQAQQIRLETDRAVGLLSRREVEILQGIMDGLGNAELARSLHLSPSTVQTYIKNILGKLDVHSKLEAVTFALRHGLIRIRTGSRQGAGQI
jgi:NarL family two-component system response regulator LiaR